MEQVVLVDEADREVGTGEKQRVHEAGLLHRAFSIFVFDRAGRLLLQRRSPSKYHSPDRWSNTCCGHPRPREPLEVAARRRLREEMGLDCALRRLPPFRYRAHLDGGLVENEVDHLLVGVQEGDPTPDPAEVDAWRRVDRAWLLARLASHPEEFTAWLCLIAAARPAVLGVRSAGRSEEALPVPEAEGVVEEVDRLGHQLVPAHAGERRQDGGWHLADLPDEGEPRPVERAHLR